MQNIKMALIEGYNDSRRMIRESDENMIRK